MSDAATPTGRTILTGIEGSVFQHPLDRDATNNLKMLAGFDKLVAKFIELRYERLFYLFNIANCVRVGSNQFPRIYAMLRENCAVLDMSEPELYVSQQPMVNALTFGHSRPFIVLFTSMINLMDDDELQAVIAHELGHIKCGHVLYNSMATLVQDVIAIISQFTFGLGRIVGASIEAALMDWRRRSELSADRAMMLALQDARPCLHMLTKLAGGTTRMPDQLNPDEFLNQARAYAESDGSMLDSIYRSLAEFSQGNHPFAVERAKELDAWARSPEYAQIVAGEYPRPAPGKVQVRVNTGPKS